MHADHHGTGAEGHGVPRVSFRDFRAGESTDGVDVDVQRGLAGPGRNFTSRKGAALPRCVYAGLGDFTWGEERGGIGRGERYTPESICGEESGV